MVSRKLQENKHKHKHVAFWMKFSNPQGDRVLESTKKKQ